MLTYLYKNTYAPKVFVYILLILSLSYITQQQQVLPAPLPPLSIKTCSFGQFRTANNQCMQCLVTCPKCKDYVSKCPGCAQDQKLNSNNICQPCGFGVMNCNNPTNLVGGNGITCQPLYHEINNVCKPICQIRNCLECISIFANTCKVCATGYALSYDNTFCKQASRRMLQTTTTLISPPPSLPPTPSTTTITSSLTNTSSQLPQIKSTSDILKNQNITVDQNVKVNVDNIVPTTTNNLNTGFNNMITNITTKNPGVNNFLNQILVNKGVMSTSTSTSASTTTTTTTATTNTNTNTVNGAINSFSINPTNFTTGFGDIPNFSTNSFTSFNSNTVPPFSSTSSTSASTNASNNTGFGVFTTQPITTISSTTNSSVFNINNTSTPATTTTTSTTRTTSTTTPTNIAQPVNIINPTTNSTTITTPTLTTISTTPLPINTTTIINNPTSTKTTTNATSTTTITLPNSTLPINLPTSTIPIASPTSKSTVPTTPISISPFITPSTIPLSINSCRVGYYYNATISECSPCNPKCATCINTDSQCLECANGWKKFGWKCIRNQTIAFRLGFQIPTTLKQAPTSTNTSNTTFEQQLTNHLKSLKNDLFTNILPSEYRNQSLSPLSITGLSLDNLKKYLTLEMLLDKVVGTNLQNIKKTMIQKLQTKTSLGSLLLKSFNLGQQTATGQIQYNNNNYYSNNTNENKTNVLAIILTTVLGGILCFCCIPLLLCYCCKKCCFKQEQSKQNFQTYQYAGPTSTQRRHTTIQPNVGSGQTVTYLPTNNNPPSINWQSGQTVNYKSGTNIELQKIGNNNKYIQQEIGSDDILDSDAAANKNKPQYNSNGFSDQVVDYANDKYNENAPKRGIY